jgi:biopolymer transport protein ExbD
MFELIPPRKKKEPMSLQLTAMIDIFSMVVIFLIMGSVFGGADIQVPFGIKLPKSNSQGISSSAPTLGIANGKVFFSGVGFASRLGKVEISLEKFQEPSVSRDPEVLRLRRELNDFVARLPKKSKSAGVLLNVVSDRLTPYRDVYNAVSFFRSAGFDTLMLVAAASGGKHP